MYTQASNKATQRYHAKAYDNINVRIPKGQREKLQQYCSEHGVSVNRFICDLVQKETNLIMYKSD